MQETQEMQVRPLGWEDPLEEEMATHSRMLAWEIPWTEGAWWATVHRAAKIWTQLNMHTHTHTHTALLITIFGSFQVLQTLPTPQRWWVYLSAAPFSLFSVLHQISLAFGGICLRSSLLNISWVNILPSACFVLRGHQHPGHWRSRNKWNTGSVL